MPALNFKSQFANAVIAGTKPCTIRALRKRRFHVDDDLSFFTGMRTKTCRRLRPNTPCTKATPIVINRVGRSVVLGSEHLTDSEVDALAHRDGFNTVEEFWEFFGNRPGPIFYGQLVEWNPSSAPSV
jgi:hypothetical protein